MIEASTSPKIYGENPVINYSPLEIKLIEWFLNKEALNNNISPEKIALHLIEERKDKALQAASSNFHEETLVDWSEEALSKKTHPKEKFLAASKIFRSMTLEHYKEINTLYRNKAILRPEGMYLLCFAYTALLEAIRPKQEQV